MRYYKLRVSALIPSKWFHELKNMSKPNKENPLPSYSFHTTKMKKSSADSKSLPHSSSSTSYFSNRSHTSLESNKIPQISPRNSLRMKQSKRKTVYKPSPPPPSVSAGFNKNKTKSPRNHDSSYASSNLKLSSSANDIIIDINSRDSKKNMSKDIKVFDSTEKACSASNPTEETLITHHPPMKVNNKEKKPEEDSCRFRKKHQQTLVSNGRRSSDSANSPRMRLKVNSPRVQVTARRSKSRSQNRQVLESFAVIKNSVDPKKDFRESMVEMITENKIRASKDLEDLLVCYLSLNPKEYHDLIIKVFVQVRLDLITNKFA